MRAGAGKYFVVAVNPEPWAVGPLGIGRKGKSAYPYMGPNQKVQAYQEALKEQLEGAVLTPGLVEVNLYIWRRLDTARVYSGRARKAVTSDATNIQKATEDAIQGILIENDRNVRRITTEIVQQDDKVEPCIVIYVQPYVPSPIEGAIIADVLASASKPWANESSNPLSDIQTFLEKRGERIEDLF